MKPIRIALLGIALGAALTAGAALADEPTDSVPCFSFGNWHSWRSPSPDVLYLRVSMTDVYRVDLSSGPRLLRDPSAHLINGRSESEVVCSAKDLQLEVADSVGMSGGARVHLVATKLTKLTPEEIAAIPKQFRP